MTLSPGTVAVSAGKVEFAPSPAGQPPPLLDWEDGVVVLVNGAPPLRPHPLVAGDLVVASAGADAPNVDLEIVVAPDGMSASLRSARTPGVQYRLRDEPPNRSVLLRRLIAGRVACPPPTLEEMSAALAAAGVIHGIQFAVVRHHAAGVTRPEPVAIGTRAVEGRDGALVLVNVPANGANGGLWSVAAGAEIAHITPQRPGRPGRDVRGRVVEMHDARPAADVGEGAELDTGGSVRATRAGYPVLADGVLQVHDDGMIDPPLEGAGEIVAQASLCVTGTVGPNASLRVLGNLVIEGGLERSRVDAGRRLEITGAAISSQITAGLAFEPFPGLGDLLDSVPIALRSAHGMASKMAALEAARGSERNAAKAAAQVAERHLGDHFEHLQQAVAGAARQQTPPVIDLLRRALALIDGTRRGVVPFGALLEAAAVLEGAAVGIGAADDGTGGLRAAALQGCTVEVAGGLHVHGSGAVGSSLQVYGDALLEGHGLRGGSLEVTGHAHVTEIGSLGGTLTRVVLASGARLTAEVVHAGTVVETPAGSQTFTREVRDVEIGADSPCDAASDAASGAVTGF